MLNAIKRLFSAEPELTVKATPQRNDPCPCGSGRKYKSCCIANERRRR